MTEREGISMKEIRLIGNCIEKLIKEQGLCTKKVAKAIGVRDNSFQKVLNGRMFLSFEQLEQLAKLLSVTIEELLNGDLEHYNQTIVHCNGTFENEENREEILDIIDMYITLKEADYAKEI